MSYSKLAKDISAGNISPMYCFYGPETYLSDQLIKILRGKLISPDYADFNEQVLDGTKLTVEEGISAFETLPFFAEKRLIIIKQLPWFGTAKNGMTEEDEEKLIQYINNPCPSSVVVMVADSVDKRKRVGKALSKQNALFEFGKVEESDLKKIMIEKLNVSGCEMSEENIKYCIYLLGYLEKDADRTLYDVMGQLDRLISTAGGKTIERDLLNRTLEKPLDTNIFAYMDAVSDGKTLDALRIKQQLLSEDFNEIQINSMLYKHFRNLYKTVLWLDKGYNPTVIAEKIGVHPFSAKKYASQCRQFKPAYLRQLVIDLAELDHRMKTGKIGFEAALDLMTVSLSQRQNLPLGSLYKD